MATTFTLVQRHKGRGIKTWYIRTCINGKESFKSTGTTIKAEAMKVFAKYTSSTTGGVVNSADKVVLADEIEDWMRAKDGQVGINGTMNTYRYAALKFKRFCEERNIRTLSDFTPIAAQTYVDLLKSELKVSTLRHRHFIAKNIIDFAIERHEIQMRNPFSHTKTPKKKDGLVEFWTIDECERIISNAPSIYYAAFWGLMAFAGLRYFEAWKVSVEDICDNAIIVKHGKGDKDAVVPINERLKSLLEPVVAARGSGSLFSGEVPKMNYTNVRRLREAILKAGMEIGSDPRLNHKFRHSFASNLLRRGANLTAVQKLGRWSSAQVMLKHYAGVIDKDLVDAVSLL